MLIFLFICFFNSEAKNGVVTNAKCIMITSQNSMMTFLLFFSLKFILKFFMFFIFSFSCFNLCYLISFKDFYQD